MHAVVGAQAQADALEQLLDAVERDAVQAGVEAQVLAAREVAVQQRLVRQQPDPPADGPAVVRERPAEHAHDAGVRAQQRGEDPQQRRLAGAVGAEDDERRARRDRRG